MILITSGCSFSETALPWIDTWPRHLASKLNVDTHISRGMSSQGNGLISRKVLYSIYDALKTYTADELLVGIMWSGPARGDYLIEDLAQFPKLNPSSFHSTCEIPTNVGEHKRWAILNPHWKHKLTNDYYRVNGHEFLLYQTLEHILRLQWFLKLHNIKYFMSAYTTEVLGDSNTDENNHLHEMIDFTQWLPIDGCYEWCRDHSGLPMPTPSDNHPSSEQHGIFTDRIIIPFLKEKNYV